MLIFKLPIMLSEGKSGRVCAAEIETQNMAQRDSGSICL